MSKGLRQPEMSIPPPLSDVPLSCRLACLACIRASILAAGAFWMEEIKPLEL